MAWSPSALATEPGVEDLLYLLLGGVVTTLRRRRGFGQIPACRRIRKHRYRLLQFVPFRDGNDHDVGTPVASHGEMIVFGGRTIRDLGESVLRLCDGQVLHSHNSSH